MSLKRVAVLVTVFAVGWSAAAPGAEPQTRDQWVTRIESQYLSAKFSDDAPFFNAFVEQAKLVNPKAPADVWPVVRAELVAGYQDLLFGQDSALDRIVHRALEPLAVKDLQHLSALLDDPVYKQFTGAITSPGAQKEFQNALVKAGVAVGPMWNLILERHQLNAVR